MLLVRLGEIAAFGGGERVLSYPQAAEVEVTIVPGFERKRLAAIFRWFDLNHAACQGLAAAGIDDFAADVPCLGRRIRLLCFGSMRMERKQQRKHERDADRWAAHLRFSGHDLELHFRFATAGERHLLAERQIPLQRLIVAVSQLLLMGQRQHQVAAGGNPLERSLRGGIGRRLTGRGELRLLGEIIQRDGSYKYLAAAAIVAFP